MELGQIQSFVKSCIRFLIEICPRPLDNHITSLDTLCEFLDTLVEDHETMTNLTLLYTGFLAFNRNGRLEFIKLMDDVLTLANSETIYDDKYDNDSLLTRFVKSSVRPTNETFDVFA